MSHNHHDHPHTPARYNRVFFIGVLLNTTYVVVEATYGVLASSLALIADAGHNLSDVLGLLLAWGASVLAGRKPTVRRTYGLRRATILASLSSAILLLMTLGGVAWEAIGRFQVAAPVSGMTIILVAGIGVMINTATALLFVADRKRDLNIKGAYLHMVADASVSLGVALAGLGIIATGWLWLDPAISLLIAAIVLVATWGLFRDSVNLAVDAVPRHIDAMAVHAYLTNLPGVVELHDLHIWAMSTTESALTAHLLIPDAVFDDHFRRQVAHDLHDKFGIEHATIQIERGAVPCEQAHPDSV